MSDALHFLIWAEHVALRDGLARGLRAQGWQVWTPADVAPGEDTVAQHARAFRQAAVIVVHLHDAARVDTLTELSYRLRHPLGRVVPVGRGEVDLADPRFSTLNLLQTVDLDPGIDHVAAELHRLGVRLGLRTWGAQTIRVGLVSVLEDPDVPARRIGARLLDLSHLISDVLHIHPGDPTAAAQLAAVDLRVALLGARHGGGLALLSALVDEAGTEDGRTLVFRVDYNPDTVSAAHETEEPQVRRLRKRLPPDGAGTLTERVVAGALACHRRISPPSSAVADRLAPWERAWLERQREPWRVGDPSTLRVRPALPAPRARWFVLLQQDNPSDWEAPPWLDELLSDPERPRVLLLGPAGAGKSATLQHVAWVLAADLLGEPLASMDDEPAHRLELSDLRDAAGMLPIPILHPATALARALRTPDPRSERPIWEALTALLCSADTFGPDADPVTVRRGLMSGRYQLLLDGLDEVPDRRDQERITQALGALHGPIRVILSATPGAQAAGSAPEGFDPVSIAPLNDERIGRLTRVWLQAHGLDPASVADALPAIRALQADVPTDDDGRSLPESPLLLTTLLGLFLQHRRLPDDRAALYDQLVRRLCASGQAEGDREALQVLGLALQEAGGTSLPVDAAAEALRQASGAPEVPAARLDALIHRTGLLRVETWRGRQVIRPWHRSVQEYLAACQIAARYPHRAEDGTAWLGPRLNNPSWTGCLRFLVGVLGQVDPQHALRCVESWLQAAQPGARREARMLALAAGGAAGCEAWQGPPQRARLAQEIAARYAARGADWPWEDRLDALQALGRLGDPRLPDPRHIPSWSPQTGWAQVHSRLWVRVWPVTVAEYAAFVAAGGAEPGGWSTQRRGANRPVVQVSWHDALAFCAWADGAWFKGWGGALGLPTCAEWTLAATQRTGRAYPWGGDAPGQEDQARAACAWGGNPFGPRGGAAPVGAFPRGHTPERGLQGPIWDLGGNVWEWCEDRHPSGGAAPQGGLDGRKLRGGCWSDRAERLRVADESYTSPGDRLPHVGFRVVCRGSGG